MIRTDIVEGEECAVSFERPAAAGPEPAPPSAARARPRGDRPVTPEMRLQILSTEHWSLLASRSLAWNEAFSRAAMFLSVLSGAIIALALVAQATAFGEGFRLFALVILPVVLLVGVGTLLRLGMSNYHEVRCVIGMNRIRAAYMELAPDLEKYLVMGTTDDERGLFLTTAVPPGTSFAVQMLASTPLMVMAINALIVAIIVGLAAIELGGVPALALALGAIGFVAMSALLGGYAARSVGKVRREHQPIFPTGQPTSAGPGD